MGKVGIDDGSIDQQSFFRVDAGRPAWIVHKMRHGICTKLNAVTLYAQHKVTNAYAGQHLVQTLNIK